MSTSNQTHDHRIIQEWVEKRKGIPTRVKGTGKQDDDGLLRIHFPENSKSDNFEEMEWDDFFADFERNKLDFLYQDKKTDGETSTFHKFVERK
jgi:hypothetical protein